MRELKFRAWNGKKMQYQFDGITNCDTFKQGASHSLMVNIGGYHWGIANWGKKVELMQYTGVKDSKDNEIYEGDIVEYYEGTRAEVIFKDGQFIAYDGNASSSDEAYLLLSNFDNMFDDSVDLTIEVIGNIHDNKNLLNL